MAFADFVNDPKDLGMRGKPSVPPHLSRTARVACAVLTATLSGHAAASLIFTPGDLVVSLVGQNGGPVTYTDNQAAPIVLQQLTTTGQLAGSLTLPQTTTTVNGVTQYAVSGEYGSSSEGLLHLSGDGHSLVIAGYGVNAATYNTGGAATYGDARLAQSTSVPGGAYTAVPRVIADISASGVVDSSTGLYNVFNTNNPRSVATVDGSSFYIAGQGVKGDTTQGVFYAQKGASSATAITTTSDYRSVEIANGQLFATRDYKGSTNIAEVDTFSTKLPTAASTPTALPGIGPSVTVNAASNNGVNASRSNNFVYLSPEDYFFVSGGNGDQYVYIADAGKPKNGNAEAAGLGDGGLQKWKLVNGVWQLQYDIFAGLGLVDNSSASGTTGLIGLTGQLIGGTVYLYATNETVGDLDQTYLYSVSDPLAQTSRGLVAGSDVFTAIYMAPAGTNVRGVAFAPVPEPQPIALAMIGLVAAFAARRRASKAEPTDRQR